MLAGLLKSVAGLFGTRSVPTDPNALLASTEFWDRLFGNFETDSGVSLTHEQALSLAAVWQCGSMIANDIARLPLDNYARGEGEVRSIDRRHPSFRIVRRRANPEQGAFNFWRTIGIHALVWGNGYSFIDRDGAGRPLQMLHLLPDRTYAQRIQGKLWYVTETTREDGSPWLKALYPEDVFHLKGLSIDGIKGMDVIHTARHTLGLMSALNKFASRFFKQGARAGGVLEIPNTVLPNIADKMEEGFRNSTGEENWFRTAILRDGAKFHTNQISPNEGQMLESRQEQIREVARIFNLRPSRLGLDDSVSYNSKAEDNRDYLDTTLSPWLRAITDECYMKLLSAAEQAADSHFFEHNTAALLAMNTLQRYQVYEIGVRARILRPNEARAFENLPPYPGGDEFPNLPGASATPIIADPAPAPRGKRRQKR